MSRPESHPEAKAGALRETLRDMSEEPILALLCLFGLVAVSVSSIIPIVTKDRRAAIQATQIATEFITEQTRRCLPPPREIQDQPHHAPCQITRNPENNSFTLSGVIGQDINTVRFHLEIKDPANPSQKRTQPIRLITLTKNTQTTSHRIKIEVRADQSLKINLEHQPDTTTEDPTTIFPLRNYRLYHENNKRLIEAAKAVEAST